MTYGENIFTAMIDENGTIWDVAAGRKRQSVGVDAQKEQEYIQTITDMQETLDSYYGKLVELGVIKPAKTPEEIAMETATAQLDLARQQAEQQAQINQELLQAIRGLKTEIGELKSNGHVGYGNESGDKPVGQNSQSAGKIPATGKKGSGAGQADAARNNGESHG